MSRWRGPTCGTYYYDTKLGRSFKVASYRLSISQLEEPQLWSPGGSYGPYVALASQEEAVLVNLATGRSFDVGQMLGIEVPRRTIRFGPWRPDGAMVVALVTNDLDAQAPFVNVEQDLFLISPREENFEYVASIAPRGWSREQYEWQESEAGWTITAHSHSDAPALAGPEGIRRKRPYELPRPKPK